MKLPISSPTARQPSHRRRNLLRHRLRVESLEERRLLAADLLFADSFEAGEWNGQWVEDSQNDWHRSTQRSTDGSRSAELNGRANDATLTLANPLDLTATVRPSISYIDIKD